MKALFFKELVTVLCVFLLGVVLGLSGFSCSKGESGIAAEAAAGKAASGGLELDGSELAAPVIVPREAGQPDFILSLYRDKGGRDGVVEFFAGLTGSRELAAVVLANTAVFDIPPALAFSLCWEESRYNPHAVNRANQNQTVDRGLFQLNNRSFPHLEEPDFFNPSINAWYGLSHLRWCLDTAGTEVSGLAMYNAGTTRVRSGGTPKNTLDYVSRILTRQRKIEEQFLVDYAVQVALAETPPIAEKEEKKAGFRLSLLSPLGGR
jgi:hypothetical protein